MFKKISSFPVNSDNYKAPISMRTPNNLPGILILTLLLLPLQMIAQNITGIWTGMLQTNGANLPYEIAISNDGGRLTGYSLTIFNIDGYENVGVKAIRLKEKPGAIMIEDDRLLYNNYSGASRRSKLLGEMLLSVHDTILTLQGRFRTRPLDFRSNSPTFSGTITLRKLNTPEETKLVTTLREMNLLGTLRFDDKEETIKKETAALPPQKVKNDQKRKPVPDSTSAAADLASRKTEIIQNVFFKSDSLILKLYDHGVIDGDTVSVVLNGKVIAARQGLTGKPVVSVIHITPELGDSLLLVMYAESLGSIPPNTGLLVIMDGDNRYEIRFEGTKQKSSAILLTRKRK